MDPDETQNTPEPPTPEPEEPASDPAQEYENRIEEALTSVMDPPSEES